MAHNTLKITIQYRWWYRPGVALMKVFARVGFPPGDAMIERFVSRSVRLVFR